MFGWLSAEVEGASCSNRRPPASLRDRMAWSLFLFLAGLLYYAIEIRRLIRAAAPFVAGHLRIRTKRARARRRTLWIRALPFRGNDLIRRDALFHPTFERQRQIMLRVGLRSSDHLAKAVRARSAGAMLHARRHIQPHEIVRLPLTKFCHDALKIIDDVHRRPGRVIPAGI